MHSHTVEKLACKREPFEASKRERGVRGVVILTTLMMIVELGFGYLSHSMALTADGWHMGTHAGALGLSAFAYWLGRRYAHHKRFAFGTDKIHSLAGFTSAILLMVVALSVIVESLQRLIRPESINFDEALWVAGIGLVVNLVSLKLLHHHDDHVHDHNHLAAYVHVMADALTSLLAIAALILGRTLGWVFLDPLMGIVGSAIVLRWGVGLCYKAGLQLLDAQRSDDTEVQVRAMLESVDDVRVADLHIWQIGPARRIGVVTVVTSSPRDTNFYREKILALSPIDHLTVEVQRCAHNDIGACP